MCVCAAGGQRSPRQPHGGAASCARASLRDHLRLARNTFQRTRIRHPRARARATRRPPRVHRVARSSSSAHAAAPSQHAQLAPGVSLAAPTLPAGAPRFHAAAAASRACPCPPCAYPCDHPTRQTSSRLPAFTLGFGKPPPSKADPRRHHDWIFKCLQGGRTHPLAASCACPRVQRAAAAP